MSRTVYGAADRQFLVTQEWAAVATAAALIAIFFTVRRPSAFGGKAPTQVD